MYMECIQVSLIKQRIKESTIIRIFIYIPSIKLELFFKYLPYPSHYSFSLKSFCNSSFLAAEIWS